MRETRATLERWKRDPWPTLRDWALLSLAIALTLITTVWAGQLAILFVAAVTIFSLSTQAWVLGFQGATIPHQLGVPPLELVALPPSLRC